MKQVVIKRSQWTAGSLYRQKEDTYCAIGFAMRSAGFEGTQVRRFHHSDPDMTQIAGKLVAAGIHKLVCPVTDESSGGVEGFVLNGLAQDIIDINDKQMGERIRTLNPERERLLTEAFKRADLELVFED